MPSGSCERRVSYFLQVKSSSDYISDISLAASNMHLAVAAASNGLLWLDCRNVQTPQAVLRCPVPVQRCKTDGKSVLAALEDATVIRPISP